MQLSGCAAVLHDLKSAEDTRIKNCNYDGAFKLGMDEASKGFPLDTNMATIHCDGEEKKQATQGYRDGYMTGKKSK